MKKVLSLCGIMAVCACNMAQQNDDQLYTGPQPTPTVDYIEQLDVYSAPHRDSFLNQLAMNYRSYAIYNARTTGDTQMGELFAQKAVAAFSGETPFPETIENWPVQNEDLKFQMQQDCRNLINALKNDAADTCPEMAAEAQAKFDCWLSAASTGQMATAQECDTRFHKAMAALRSPDGCKNVAKPQTKSPCAEKKNCRKAAAPVYYPETSNLNAAAASSRARESMVIVNNINVPQHLINPVPVAPAQPIVFNQNIFNNGADGGVAVIPAEPIEEPQPTEAIPELTDEYVSRDEFINMMMAMREELAAINRRLDNMPKGEKAVIKVQQIPLEPKQHVMEEIFEVRFDFNKSNIKPEYEPVIQKLVETTQANRNVKISVVGHTDTVGTDAYNYALGGRRAESVRQKLISYGVPASQIVAVSSGKTDPKVPTGDGVKNAENRRVRVVKETHYTEDAKPNPMKITMKNPDGTVDESTMYDEFYEEEEFYEGQPTALY